MTREVNNTCVRVDFWALVTSRTSTRFALQQDSLSAATVSGPDVPESSATERFPRVKGQGALVKALAVYYLAALQSTTIREIIGYPRRKPPPLPQYACPY